MRARWLSCSLGAGAYAALAGLGACANTDTTLAPATAINLGVTAMSVDPMDFLGGVACSNLPGGMASYVATVVDMSDPENPFPLPSSPPTACSEITYFQNVNPGDVYVAQVDGYTQTADQLVPACGALPPGSVQNCASDGDCPRAYGCQGTCKVTTFRALNATCAATCAGSGHATAVTCAEKCIAVPVPGMPGLSEADETAIFAGCAVQCGLSASCLAANFNCLQTEFAELQLDCASSNTPAGGQAANVKACTCAYISTEGNRPMFLASDPSAIAPIVPNWQTACADGTPAQSVQYMDIPISPCTPLTGSTTGTTSIVVVPDATLGTLSCGAAVDGGSGVTGFDVIPKTAGLPSYDMQSCPTGNPVTYANVTPETNYAFTVYGYQGAATPTLCAACNAFAEFGTITTATCDPLVPIGDGGACP